MEFQLRRSHGNRISITTAVANLVVSRRSATEVGDWIQARAVHEKLDPLEVAICRNAQGGLATARPKACLKLLGKIRHDVLRLPKPQATPAELQLLRLASRIAGYLSD